MSILRGVLPLFLTTPHLALLFTPRTRKVNGVWRGTMNVSCSRMSQCIYNDENAKVNTYAFWPTLLFGVPGAVGRALAACD